MGMPLGRDTDRVIHPKGADQAAGAWVALQLVPGVGNATLRHLVDHFGSPEAVWQARAGTLGRVPDVRPAVRTALSSGPDEGSVCRMLEAMDRVGAWLLTYRDEEYPPLLKTIPDPPALLYGIGDVSSLCRPAVALVGSRLGTSYGLRVARELSGGLARHGVVVISGLARGIDTAAHEGTLSTGGRTVAVLGCGIDRVYPRENAKLFHRIATRGALVTEFLPGTGPEAHNFPIRNRIISGLSLGVVIIEAGRRSGSLITASCALEQGREVFAVPGSVCSYKSSGTHWLLKQGARLVEGVGDIFEELGLETSGMEGQLKSAPSAPTAPFSEEEQRLYDVLELYSQHLDDLARRSRLPVAQVCGLLLQMELKGLVQALPGQMYQRK